MIFIFLLGGGVCRVVYIQWEPNYKWSVAWVQYARHVSVRFDRSLYIASNVHLTYTTLYHAQVHLEMYSKVSDTLYIITCFTMFMAHVACEGRIRSIVNVTLFRFSWICLKSGEDWRSSAHAWSIFGSIYSFVTALLHLCLRRGARRPFHERDTRTCLIYYSTLALFHRSIIPADAPHNSIRFTTTYPVSCFRFQIAATAFVLWWFPRKMKGENVLHVL